MSFVRELLHRGDVPRNRATGDTTRAIDKGIQEFFEFGWTILRDNDSNYERARQHLLDRFIRRLYSEHPGVYDGLKAAGVEIMIDKKDLIVAAGEILFKKAKNELAYYEGKRTPPIRFDSPKIKH